MATLHTFRVRIFNNATGGMLTGFTNYVGFVTQGGSPGAAVPMTEDTSNPGVYYKTNVSGGYFDVYLDLDKSGSFLAGDLRLSGVRHGIGADDVSDVNIENFSIELDDLSPSVIAYIDGSGGGADPDGVTLDLNISGEMQIKDGGISTGKYGDASISASKLQEGAVTTDALGDEVVTTGKVADAAITAVKLAGASVTSDKIAGKIITGEDHITDGSIVGANLEDSAISTAKIQNLAVTGAKIADATINGDTKIIPETISGALLNDETLQARSFIPDTLEAGMMSPTLSFNTTQFERTGAPLLWQLKSSFLATFGVSYILNVLDFGADTSGAGSSSQAFQDAFDAVTDEKGIVLIPPGVYLAKNLTVKANTEIWAFGAIITIGGAAPSGESSPDTWLIKSAGVVGSVAGFLAGEEVLHHHPMTGGAQTAAAQHVGQRLLGGRQIHRHDHALTRGQTVGLDHDGCAARAHIGQRRLQLFEDPMGGGGNALPFQKGLGVAFGGFQFGRQSRRAEDRQPGGLEGIDHTGSQRRLRADYGQVDLLLPGQRQQPVDIGGFHRDIADATFPRGAGIARGGQHFADLRRGAQPPGQRMLTTACADHQYPPLSHRRRSEASRPRRLRQAAGRCKAGLAQEGLGLRAEGSDCASRSIESIPTHLVSLE